MLDFISLPGGLNVTDMKIVRIVGTLILLLCVVGQVFFFKVKYYLDLGKDVLDTPVSSHTRAQYNYKARETQAKNMQTTEFMGGETQEES